MARTDDGVGVLREAGRVVPARRGATRRDVAAAAGVSVTTVTHALNPPPGARVAPATVERVRRAARELGYRPSFVGRALKSGRTFTVGLLQPSPESMFNQLYQDILYGLVRAMDGDDYHLLTLYRSDDLRYLKPLRQGRVDGMVVLQSDTTPKHIGAVVDTGVPTVVVNKAVDVAAFAAPVGCVHSDHRAMMRDVLGEFSTLGCKRLLAIHDPRLCDANIQMDAAWREALPEQNASEMTGEMLNPAGGGFEEKVRSLLADGQHWNGVFIDGPEYAEVWVEASRRAGLEPGRDYHLITSSTRLDETTTEKVEQSAYTHKPYAVGQAAWRVLHRLMEEADGPRVELVPYQHVAVQANAKEISTDG